MEGQKGHLLNKSVSFTYSHIHDCFCLCVCVSICPVHAVLHKRVGVNGNVKVCGYCKEVLLLLALLYH